MIGDSELPEVNDGAPRKPRKRRGRPAKVKDQNGLAFDDDDWTPQYDDGTDITIDGMRIDRLGSL